jgi:hypothetical protein
MDAITIDFEVANDESKLQEKTVSQEGFDLHLALNGGGLGDVLVI